LAGLVRVVYLQLYDRQNRAVSVESNIVDGGESMNTTEINRRFSELAGICWHRGSTSVYTSKRQLDFRCYFCDFQDTIREDEESCPYDPNPDYCAHPDLVLEVMQKKKYFGDFLDYIGGRGDNIEYCSCVPVFLIMDKTGQLALLGIEWLEKNK